MASEITVSPGLFMLPLPINKDINIDKAVVETKIRDLDHFLRVRVGRPEELAILNLQGLLNLRLRRYEAALGCFNAVLAKDAENLNALANLQYVLEKLFRLAEAQHRKEEWLRLIQPGEFAAGAAESDTADEKSTENQKCLKLKARCLAEQAYAYAFDIHSETVEGKRYMQSNEMYRKAIQLAGKTVDTLEKDDWKFCMAINAHKLHDMLWYENKFSASEEYIDIAVNLFFEITQRNPGDPEFQWDSWRHLADIFRGMKNRKVSKAARPELKAYQNDPEKCMLKAMEISPNNARLLARYANFLYSLKKDMRKPLELLEQSISLDGSEFNFYAFTTRAMINLKFYTYQLRQLEGDTLKLDLLRNVLQLAKTDLEKAMSMHVTPWDLTRLGKVYYLLAKRHTEQDGEVRSLIEKALLYFTNAADCQDGHKRLDVHIMRGRCLFDIGEKRSAIGCYKQAIDCEPPTSTYTGNYNELLIVYLSILREDKPMEDKSVVAEATFSLKRALLKYGKGNMRKYCIGKLKVEYPDELQQLARYCQQFKELNQVGSLLVSEEPMAPTKSIIASGGMLKESWIKTYHSTKARNVTPGHMRVQGSSAAATAVGATAPDQDDPGVAVKEPGVGDTRLVTEYNNDETGGGGAKSEVASLAADIGDMNIKESSVAPRKQPIREAPDEARVPDFQYDFYVVYPQSERDWVSYDLLNELEAIQKLKGCTRDRDAIAGSMKFTSEIDLMETSASILLVVTKDFNLECDWHMQQALRIRKERNRGRVVIPILRDDSQVPYEIDVFNGFDATGAVDWQKLALFIEQQI